MNPSPQPDPRTTPSPVILQTALGPVEYAECGAGPAVLLLHGAMGGYDQSLLLGRSALGSRPCRFIAVSRPGYLGTPLASGRAPEQQADLCAGILDALGITDAAVIAISGGGQCALQFALRHPRRCRALVMISACSARIGGRMPLRYHLFKVMARVPAMAASIRRKAEADPEGAAARSIPDADLRARTLSHPEAGPLMAALQRSTLDRMPRRLPGTTNDVRQSRRPFDYPLERIAPPVLVVHGTEDEAAPYAMGAALARRAPNAELLTIEGGRHVSLFTHLDEIRARVGEFLNRHGTAAAAPSSVRESGS